MANKRITELVDIGTPASGDVLEIVDVSDTTDSPEGTSKKVLVSELGGGSTPSLAGVLAVSNRESNSALDGDILFDELMYTKIATCEGLSEDTVIIVPNTDLVILGKRPEYMVYNNSEYVITLEAETEDYPLVGDNLSIPKNAIAFITYLADSTQSFAVTYRLNVVSGGGGVESVTGDGVDNTDPLNPVLSYPDAEDVGAIPLSGTTSGNPVTGDIEYGVIAEVVLDEEITNKGFYQNEGDNKSGFSFSSDGASSFPVIYNQVPTLGTSLTCNESGFVVDSFGISKGISSAIDYSAVDSTNKLVYAQRKYVDNGLTNILKKYLFAGDSSITGVTTETVIQTILIPANTWSATDFNEFVAPVYKSATASALVFDLYHGLTAGATTTKVARLSLTTANRSQTYLRYMNLEGGFLNLNVANAAGQSAPFTAQNTDFTPLAFDHTIDNYFTITGDPTVVSEVAGVRSMSFNPRKY